MNYKKSKQATRYPNGTLDRDLTYRSEVEKRSKKITARGNIIQKLAGTSWGAYAKTLRTSSLGLVYSTSEYCVPVWTSSTHSYKIDVRLNLLVLFGYIWPIFNFHRG